MTSRVLAALLVSTGSLMSYLTWKWALPGRPLWCLLAPPDVSAVVLPAAPARLELKMSHLPQLTWPPLVLDIDPETSSLEVLVLGMIQTLPLRGPGVSGHSFTGVLANCHPGEVRALCSLASWGSPEGPWIPSRLLVSRYGISC